MSKSDIVNKMSYFSVYGPGPLLSSACTDSYYVCKMTNCIRMYPRYKTTSKLAVELLQIATFTTKIKISCNRFIYRSF